MSLIVTIFIGIDSGGTIILALRKLRQEDHFISRLQSKLQANQDHAARLDLRKRQRKRV